MSNSFARMAFSLVAVLAIGASVFRVATAPERIKERRNTARVVCIQAGGEWTKVDDEEGCRKTEEPAKKA